MPENNPNSTPEPSKYALLNLDDPWQHVYDANQAFDETRMQDYQGHIDAFDVRAHETHQDFLLPKLPIPADAGANRSTDKHYVEVIISATAEADVLPTLLEATNQLRRQLGDIAAEATVQITTEPVREPSEALQPSAEILKAWDTPIQTVIDELFPYDERDKSQRAIIQKTINALGRAGYDTLRKVIGAGRNAIHDLTYIGGKGSRSGSFIEELMAKKGATEFWLDKPSLRLQARILESLSNMSCYAVAVAGQKLQSDRSVQDLLDAELKDVWKFVDYLYTPDGLSPEDALQIKTRAQQLERDFYKARFANLRGQSEDEA